MQETFKQPVYVDVEITKNLSPIQGDIQLTVLKVPCYTLVQALFYFREICNLNLDSVVGVRAYKLAKIYGKSRYDFKEFVHYTGDQLDILKASFKRKYK